MYLFASVMIKAFNLLANISEIVYICNTANIINHVACLQI